MGAGFGFLLPSVAPGNGSPFVHRVAKFSHASGAISQYSLNTMRLPYGGNPVVMLSWSSGSLQLHS